LYMLYSLSHALRHGTSHAHIQRKRGLLTIADTSTDTNADVELRYLPGAKLRSPQPRIRTRMRQGFTPDKFDETTERSDLQSVLQEVWLGNDTGSATRQWAELERLLMSPSPECQPKATYCPSATPSASLTPASTASVSGLPKMMLEGNIRYPVVGIDVSGLLLGSKPRGATWRNSTMARVRGHHEEGREGT
jgi:hypothetical protein